MFQFIKKPIEHKQPIIVCNIKNQQLVIYDLFLRLGKLESPTCTVELHLIVC